ncbi:hypothetical protein LTR36_007494 [Oleoguttula mirabilis]|uniref:DnaJ-domain-containing protein n=1 Tax=Oleoguttula mirabilis TaxID=1507867 RepID=A0AAV9JU27_9PEZI|nr:hypothetical protein LTR36_007494 [Oleoguttula mirabilis]
MGASQSAGRGDAPVPGAKTSYYELLGVPRQATPEEIKKAYRSKALELHPDRNYGNVEHATRQFAEVQAAHEVLSDPQERAWYDSHESAILRGEDGEDEAGGPTYDNVRATSADDLARMVRKFNSGIAFSDAPSGFFGFVRETFAQLAKEEQMAAQWDGTDAMEYPTFGYKDDSHDHVVKRFYTAWSSFQTVKDFAWKDRYRLSEAPDRWHRRAMEAANKGYRQDSIREFNDAVRSLVAFVRKRDPRYVRSTQTDDERQKTLRNAAAAQAARARAANQEKLKPEVPERTTSREPDPLADLEGTFEDEEEEEEHVLECVICNKIFKSEQQWEAHAKSKKHLKAVNTFRKTLRKDNVDGDEHGIATPEVGKDEEQEELDDVAAEDEDHKTGTNGQASVEETTDQQHAQEAPDNLEDAGQHEKEADETIDEQVATQSRDSDTPHSEDDDYASPETIQDRLQSTTLNDMDIGTQPTTAAGSEDEAATATSKPKIGKAAQKRAKKASAGANGSSTEAKHQCVGCEAAFPTKTRLFDHLKDHPKHAALKPAAGGAKGKKKGKR